MHKTKIAEINSQLKYDSIQRVKISCMALAEGIHRLNNQLTALGVYVKPDDPELSEIQTEVGRINKGLKLSTDYLKRLNGDLK